MARPMGRSGAEAVQRRPWERKGLRTRSDGWTIGSGPSGGERPRRYGDAVPTTQTRQCPTCLTQYDGHIEFCWEDGSPLAPVGPTAGQPLVPIQPLAPIRRRAPLLGPAVVLTVGGALILGLFVWLVAGLLIGTSLRPAPPSEPIAGGMSAEEAAKTYSLEATLLLEEGRPAAAIELLERAMALQPTDPKLVDQLQRQLEAAGAPPDQPAP